jgi:hypothetical protein
MGDATDFDPDDLSDEELARALETMREDMAAIERSLQDMAMVQDLVERAEGEGFDSSEQTVAELVEFVQTEMDADEAALQELQDAADAFLETVEAESLDAVSAEAMRDWLAETGAAEDGEGGGGEGDEEGPNMEELQEVKHTVGELAEFMSDLKDMLTSHADRVEHLDRRLSELEDEPVERSLTGQAPPTVGDESESGDDTDHEDVYL